MSTIVARKSFREKRLIWRQIVAIQYATMAPHKSKILKMILLLFSTVKKENNLLKISLFDK